MLRCKGVKLYQYVLLDLWGGWVYSGIIKEERNCKNSTGKKDMMKTWKVCGAGLTTLYIIGKNADEVLSQARLINSNYNSVQLYSKEDV